MPARRARHVRTARHLAPSRPKRRARDLTAVVFDPSVLRLLVIVVRVLVVLASLGDIG